MFRDDGTRHGWREWARCLRQQRLFFEDALPVDEDTGERSVDPEALQGAVRLCSLCPVRGNCYAEAVELERGASASHRDGIRAGMTPAQRESAEKRNAVRCPKCDSVLDPILVKQGIVRCPTNRRHLNRVLPPIPLEGDGWTKRHTALTRKVLRWMTTNRRKYMPSATALARELDARQQDVSRVYEALALDGTLERLDNGRFVRTARTKRADIETWQPPHLLPGVSERGVPAQDDD